MEEAGFSKDTIAVTYSNRVLTNALNCNAEVVAYASAMVSNSPLKLSASKKAVKDLHKIVKRYNEQQEQTLMDFEKDLEADNGRQIKSMA